MAQIKETRPVGPAVRAILKVLEIHYKAKHLTVVLLLTPEEQMTTYANMDFENPIPSRP